MREALARAHDRDVDAADPLDELAKPWRVYWRARFRGSEALGTSPGEKLYLAACFDSLADAEAWVGGRRDAYEILCGTFRAETPQATG